MKIILRLALFLGTLANAQERLPSYNDLTQEMLQAISNHGSVNINGDVCTVMLYNARPDETRNYLLNGRTMTSIEGDPRAAGTAYHEVFWISYTDGTRDHAIFQNTTGESRQNHARTPNFGGENYFARHQRPDDNDEHRDAPGSKRRRAG